MAASHAVRLKGGAIQRAAILPVDLENRHHRIQVGVGGDDGHAAIGGRHRKPVELPFLHNGQPVSALHCVEGKVLDIGGFLQVVGLSLTQPLKGCRNHISVCSAVGHRDGLGAQPGFVRAVEFKDKAVIALDSERPGIDLLFHGKRNLLRVAEGKGRSIFKLPSGHGHGLFKAACQHDILRPTRQVVSVRGLRLRHPVDAGFKVIHSDCAVFTGRIGPHVLPACIGHGFFSAPLAERLVHHLERRTLEPFLRFNAVRLLEDQFTQFGIHNFQQQVVQPVVLEVHDVAHDHLVVL